MKIKKTQQLIAAGLFIAIGLILPYVTAHAFGIPGTILLPMHIPVLLCGLVCGPWYGAASGVIIPVLSSLLTGMPPAFPMLPMMGVHLFVMGLLGGLLYTRVRMRLYPSLIITMLAGQGAYALVWHLLLFAGAEGLQSASFLTGMLQGVPGFVIQLILIPVLVILLQKNHIGVRAPESRPLPALHTAQKIIRSGGTTCVVIQNGEIIHQAEGRGVKPLLYLYDNEPEKLQGAIVADKIIGKAAAMILHLGGTVEVYGEIMSAAGRKYLEDNQIHATFGRCVDQISNRTRNGICPIENSVLDTEDPVAGLEKIRQTIHRLMQEAG